MELKATAMALALVAAGVGSASALAAETGGYLGIAAGLTSADLDTADLNAVFESDAVTTTSDDTGVGFKIFGGYRFHRNFALEAGYINFGKFTSTSTLPGGISVRSEAWAYGFNASALGIIPFNESFEVFGRFGLSLWDLTTDYSLSDGTDTFSGSESEPGASPLLGVGASFNAGSNLSIRAEFERHFDVGDGGAYTGQSDVDLISLGVLFRF